VNYFPPMAIVTTKSIYGLYLIWTK
jgi:hypothetical protein